MKHPIPNAALDDRLFFGGTAGSGKTYNAGSAVERLLSKKARVVIPDPLGVWWGLRLSADGKKPSGHDVVIFGGPHGDLPLTEHAGALIGETVAGMKESCILDLSQLGTKAAERRFMLAFLTALYKHTTGEPLHVIFDEADMWSPQRLLDKEGEAAKLLGMMETIVRRGRVKGFIPWLISQRPAVISKDVLSQVDGLIAFKLTSSQDRDAIGDWVEGQADKQKWREIWASLPTMERGQGVVWIPGRGILTTEQFPLKETFDSSRTPKRGEAVKRTAELKPLDLGALKERLATVETEAKANDPKALRAEIARLKRDAAKPVVQVDQGAVEAAEKRGHATGWNDAMQTVRASVDQAANALTALQHAVHERKYVAAAPVMQDAPRPIIKAPTARSTGPANAALPKGERACLIAIAQHTNGVRREQLTVLTGYKRSSRDAYLQRLKERCLIEQSGDRITANDAGISALGSDYEPLPTGAALQAYVLARLPEGERRVLEVLIAAYPNQVERADIDAATGYQRSSRDAYLQRLGARELIETVGRGAVKASEDLF